MIKLHLTHLLLNLHNPWVAQDVNGAYTLHMSIARLFPEKDRRMLYRLISGRYPPEVLVQSHSAPDFSWMKSRRYAQNMTTKTFVFDPKAGQRFVFRLVANPTYIDDAGVRIDCWEAFDQRKWLESKSKRYQFNLIRYKISASESRDIVKKSGDRYQISQVQYDGVLEVREPEGIEKAVALGVGRSKYLGCGLLSLAPAVGY